MVPGAHIFFFLLTTAVLRGAHAYTWSFQRTPTQCSNLSVAISGSDGTPPFRILISPFGPSPLANNVEARNILDIPFPDNQTEVQFQLTYPAGSQFVAVVSVFFLFQACACSFRASWHLLCPIYQHSLAYISPSANHHIA